MRCAFQLQVQNQSDVQRLLPIKLLEAGGWTLTRNLHLTLLHLGRVEPLADEISTATESNPTNVAQQLIGSVNRLAAKHSEFRTTVAAGSLDTWESNGATYAVLLIEAKAELHHLRTELIDSILELLETLGIGDPAAFLHESEEVGMRSLWRPHVTIATGPLSLKLSDEAHLKSGVNLTLEQVLPSSDGFLRV